MRSAWTHQTVEWSRQVGSLLHSSPSCATHFVLPDLPGKLSSETQQEFYDATHPNNRIKTIAVCRHTARSLAQCVTVTSREVDKILMVGGNNRKEESKLSTVDAVKIVQSITDVELWAVANPNDKRSAGSVCEKLHAGIRGIVTQPLLSSKAMEILETYPRNSNVTYIVGAALPRTTRNLLFWLELLEQPELKEDRLFRDHLDWFTSMKNSLRWTESQLEALSEAQIDGVHFMPLNNMGDLVSLLQTNR